MWVRNSGFSSGTRRTSNSYEASCTNKLLLFGIPPFYLLRLDPWRIGETAAYWPSSRSYFDLHIQS